MTKSHVLQSTGKLLSTLICTIPLYAHAELTALDESDLENISGQLGILIDDFKFFGHPDANIQLTFDTSLAEDSGYIDHISIYGSDSSPTCINAATPFSSCSGLSVGTVSDPIQFDIKNSSGISYVELLLPQNRSSESGIDADFRVLTNTYQSTGKIDISWVSIRDLKLAGTSMKLWSHGSAAGVNGGQPLGMSMESVLNARLDLAIDFGNSRAVNNEYEKLPPHSTNDTPGGDNKGILRLVGLELSEMRLGLFPHLPVTAGTINRDLGQAGHDPTLCSAAACAPDLYVEMPVVPNDPVVWGALYSTPRASITIDEFYMGSTSGGTPHLIGSAEIRDVRIQHIRLETRG